MVFLNSLALLIGWIFLSAGMIYFTVSFLISFYTLVFWYGSYPVSFSDKTRYAFRTGFKEFWWWAVGLCLNFAGALSVRYLHRVLGYSYEDISERKEVDLSLIEELDKESYTVWWYPFSFIKSNRY